MSKFQNYVKMSKLNFDIILKLCNYKVVATNMSCSLKPQPFASFILKVTNATGVANVAMLQGSQFLQR